MAYRWQKLLKLSLTQEAHEIFLHPGLTVDNPKWAVICVQGGNLKENLLELIYFRSQSWEMYLKLQNTGYIKLGIYQASVVSWS